MDKKFLVEIWRHRFLHFLGHLKKLSVDPQTLYTLKHLKRYIATKNRYVPCTSRLLSWTKTETRGISLFFDICWHLKCHFYVASDENTSKGLCIFPLNELIYINCIWKKIKISLDQQSPGLMSQSLYTKAEGNIVTNLVKLKYEKILFATNDPSQNGTRSRVCHVLATSKLNFSSHY